MPLTAIAFCILVVNTHAQDDQTCVDSTPHARRGPLLLQAQRDSPQEMQGVALTTQMTQMEARVTQLEEVSNQGRTELKNGVDTLTATVAKLKSGGAKSLEDTAARVGAAEGAIDALDSTAAGNHVAVRAEIEALKTRFDSLTTAVGDRFNAALLQTNAQQEPEGGEAASALEAAEATDAPAAAAAAPAAPATSAGGSLKGRCTALEGRVVALEALSNQGRDDLQKELEALAEEVESIRAGGVSSLEHTTVRQGSAESQLAALRDHADAQTADMKSDLDSIDGKLKTLGKKLGADQPAALLQTGVRQPVSSTELALTTRMSNLMQRIQSLEGKSGQGRVDIQNNMTALSAKVDGMTAGGVDSLQHTTLRTTSTEQDIAALTGGVQTAHTDLLATVAAMQAKTTALEQLVGSA